MRVGPLILPLLLVGTVAPSLSRADGDDTATPQGYTWCALEHFSGKVLIPTGWFCIGIRVPGGTGYQITNEEVVSKSTGDRTVFTSKPVLMDVNRLSIGADYRTGFTIKVISGPFWTKSRLSTLAEGLFEDRRREGRMSALLDSAIGTYAARSFNREGVEVVGNVIETKHFVELILQDTETPTLIFVTFDCPLSAWPQNKDCCERFFATLSLFLGANPVNHSPYSPHAAATTAAVAAAAAAHDPVETQKSVPDKTVFRIRGP